MGSILDLGVLAARPSPHFLCKIMAGVLLNLISASSSGCQAAT